MIICCEPMFERMGYVLKTLSLLSDQSLTEKEKNIWFIIGGGGGGGGGGEHYHEQQKVHL